MSDISAVHYQYHTDERGLTVSITVTRHFTRQGVKDTYVEVCAEDPAYTNIYVGDDVVISEVKI